MSRCKACNKKLTAVELDLTKDDGSPEDLCLDCLSDIIDECDFNFDGYEDFEEDDTVITYGYDENEY